MRLSSAISFFISVVLILTLFSSAGFAKETKGCAKAAELSEEASKIVSSNPGKAVKKLREAIAACGSSASLHFNLGMALYLQQEVAEAETALETSLQLDPDNARALNAIAFLQATKKDGDRARAEKLARKAVSLDPANEHYRATLALLKIEINVDNAPRTATSRPDAIAVVIGNQQYKHSILPSVKYAVQDAATIKKYLTESLGFDAHNILYYENATFVDLLTVFGDANDHRGLLYNRTHKDKSDIFVFYSGHGAPDTNTRKAYLVPSDADPSIIKFSGYSLDTLYENLAKLSNDRNPQSVTVVLDSCFSGGSDAGMIITDASPIYIEVSAPLLTMKNAVVFSSSKGNQISSWYPEKNHGLFTYFFLKALKENIEQGKTVTVADMEKALLSDDSVNEYAMRLHNRQQEPQVVGNKSLVLVQ